MMYVSLPKKSLKWNETHLSTNSKIPNLDVVFEFYFSRHTQTMKKNWVRCRKLSLSNFSSENAKNKSYKQLHRSVYSDSLNLMVIFCVEQISKHMLAVGTTTYVLILEFLSSSLLKMGSLWYFNYLKVMKSQFFGNSFWILSEFLWNAFGISNCTLT